MRKRVWKRIGAVLLSTVMILSNSSMMTLAEEVAVEMTAVEAEEEAVVEEIVEIAEEVPVLEEVPEEEEVITESASAAEEETIEEMTSQEDVVEDDTEEQIIGDTDEIIVMDEAPIMAVEEDAAEAQGSYEYELPADSYIVVINSGIGFDKGMDCVTPDGGRIWVEYNSVEIIDQWKLDESGNKVTTEETIGVLRVEEDRYEFEVLGEGGFTIEFTYTDQESGVEEKWLSDVTVAYEKWGMDLWSDSGVHQMLPGSSMTLTAGVWCDFVNENGDLATKWPENLYYRWSAAEKDSNGEECPVIIEPQGNTCLVTASPDRSAYGAFVYCEAYLDEACENLAAAGEFGIGVDEQFYKLEVSNQEELSNLYPGASLEMDAALYSYSVDEEPTLIEKNVEWFFDAWDPGVVQITDADGKILSEEDRTGTAPFTLKKKQNTESDIWVSAAAFADGEQIGEAGANWHMNWHNYDVWFDDLRENEHTWVFDNEDYILNLNTENLNDKENISVQWLVGRWNEAEEEFEVQVLETDGYYTIGEDGYSITLHGDKLAEYYQPRTENGWFQIDVTVFSNDVPVSGTGVGVDTAVAFCDYYHPLSEPGERTMLVGQDIRIGDRTGVYIENADHPHGWHPDTELNFECIGQYTWNEDGTTVPVSEEEPVIELNRLDGEWQFVGLRDGFARFRLIWNSVTEEGKTVVWEGNEEEGFFEIVSCGGKTYLNMDYPDRSNRMMKNDTMEVWTNMHEEWIEWVEDEPDYRGQEIVDYRLEVEPSYNTDLVDISILDDGKTILITSKNNEGGGSAYIRALNADGDEIGGNNVYFEVWNDIYSVALRDADGNKVEPANPLPGGELDLNGYTVEIRHHNSEDNTITVVNDDDFRVRLLAPEHGGYNSEVLADISQEEDIYPVLQRISDGGTHLQFVVEQRERDEQGNICLDEEENEIWNERGCTEFYLDGYDFNTHIEGMREDGWTFVYNNEDVTLSLNRDNLYEGDQLREGVSIQWVFGIWDEEAGELGTVIPETFYELNADHTEITLYGEKLQKTYAPENNVGLHLEPQVYVNDMLMWRQEMGVDVRHARYEYEQHTLSEPGDRDMLRGHEIRLDRHANVWVEDAEHIHGEHVETQLVGVEILGQYTWSENGDIPLSEVEMEETPILLMNEDEYGWRLEGLNYGYVKLKLTWASVEEEGKTVSYGEAEGEEFIISVVGDKGWLNMDYPDYSNQMIRNSEMEVWTNLRREWFDEEGNHCSEEIQDYVLVIDADENGNPYYNTDLIEVEVVEDTKLLVKSKNETGGECIFVHAFSKENPEWEIGCANLYVDVQEGYIRAVSVQTDADGNVETWEDGSAKKRALENVLLGEELDLNTYTFQIWHYDANFEGGKQVLEGEDYRIRLPEAHEGYNSDVLEVSEEQGEHNFPVLKRISNGGTHIQLIVEERERDEAGNVVCDGDGNEIWHEIGRSEYRLDEYCYDTYFEELRGGDWTWIFVDEDHTLSLKTDNLLEDGQLRDGVEIQWNIGEWNDEREQVEDLVAESDGYYTVNETNTAIVLHSEKLAEKYLSEEDNWFHVDVKVLINEEEVYRIGTGVRIDQPEYSYQWPLSGINEDQLMRGWGVGFGSEMNCWVRNEQNPYGTEDVWVDITDVEILGYGYEFDWDAHHNGGEQTYPEDVVPCIEKSGNAEEGWHFQAVEGGYAYVAVHYTSVETGEPDTYRFPIFVTNQRYELNYHYPDGVDRMVTNDTITIDTDLYRWIENDNGEQSEGSMDEYRLSVLDGDGNPMYDTELLQIEVDGTQLKVTSNDNRWETDIWVRVFGTDLEGNEDMELTNQCIRIGVDYGYCYIVPVTMEENPPLLHELNLNDLEKVVYDKATGCDPRPIEEVKYRIEFDENVWNVKTGTEEDDIPVLIRKNMWETSVCLIAMVPDGNGEWNEITRRDYWFPDVREAYSVDFIYSYGGHGDNCEECYLTSRALTDIPLVLSVDESGLHGLEGYEVQWNVWKWNEETQQQERPEAVAVVSSEDGRSISLTGKEEYLGEYTDVEVAIIYNGEHICSNWTHVMSDTCEHSWNSGTVTKAATCTAAGTLVKTCANCGAQKSEVIKALGHTGGTATCTKAPVCSRCKVTYGKAKGHNMGSWTVVTKATVFKAEQQKQTCKNGCGHSVTKTVGSKLAPTIKLTDSKITLKTKQSTTGFTVTGLANGDSIKSITLNKTTYVKISNINLAKGTFKLTAQKKKDTKSTTKLIITLASGLKKEVPIKVQTGAVKTTKVTGVDSKLTLAKGKKLTLSPVRVPFTSTEKFKYTTSNKKVVKVSSKGQLTAVAPGTAKITVKAGSKKATCTVTVPGIGNVKSSVTVKRKKSTTLKPKLFGISGKATFTSLNPAVATVSASGKVTGVAKGKTTITIKAGSYTVNCKVTVK